MGEVTSIIDLTYNSREIRLKLKNEMEFLPGSFVNIFTDINGEKIRRAYSISSDRRDKNNITISVKSKNDGLMSQIFWDKNILGRQFDIMGPLGINTSDKINKNKVYFFAFGIGVSVIKSILEDLVTRKNIKEVFVISGSFNEEDIIYKDFFEKMREEYSQIKDVRFVLSNPEENDYQFKGYIQQNIDDYDFNNSDVYICGQEIACKQLILEIEKKKPKNINFLVESFH